MTANAKVDITPRMMAEAFWEMPDYKQAEFFRELHSVVSDYAQDHREAYSLGEMQRRTGYGNRRSERCEMSDRMTYAETVAVIADKQEEIRRQLAEKDAEIERLKDQYKLFAANGYAYRDQLAESQAREVKLREALDAVQQVANRSEGIAGWHMNGDIASWDSILPEVEQALDIPTDDTALREMIANVKEST